MFAFSRQPVYYINTVSESPEQKLFRVIIQLAICDANKPCTRNTVGDPIPVSATLFLFSKYSPFPAYAKLIEVDYRCIRRKLLTNNKFLNIGKRYFFLKRTNNLHNRDFYDYIANIIYSDDSDDFDSAVLTSVDDSVDTL